ncbi:biliverdin-producing heme oxygenase [Runella sp.]|uniref:biliverdin-producing heme oxygenase n=1 Tax=Runella sp. TaxID=1960881 RepID=UPI003D113CE1
MQEMPIKDFQSEKNDFLKRLRTHTQPLHTGLEQHPISTSLLHPQVSQGDYIRYLQIMHEVVSHFEKSVFPQLASFVDDIDQRRKTGWLEQDLRDLGNSPGEIPQQSVDPSPSDTTIGYLMGKMYVLEGSTLGGTVIYKQLQPILGFTPEKGGKYFFGYGPKTGSMWKSFIDKLSALAIDGNESENILKGASGQFLAMQAFFDTRL